RSAWSVPDTSPRHEARREEQPAFVRVSIGLGTRWLEWHTPPCLLPSRSARKLKRMHLHSHGEAGTKRVVNISRLVTVAYIALLVVAGIRAHSLALLSEAGHNLSDLLALLLSLVAVYLQSRPPSATKTYGYHRAGVLAALVNAASLVGVSFLIIYE